ncbi:hypothetical protein [Absidia glauca]|uniref:Uncharacterized protein n=1 Tax=Absidia glauca TaxID=4829 RepID=A0A163J4P3_ABSGL|nr:hypothetical protein [Absidia glauca]
MQHLRAKRVIKLKHSSLVVPRVKLELGKVVGGQIAEFWEQVGSRYWFSTPHKVHQRDFNRNIWLKQHVTTIPTIVSHGITDRQRTMFQIMQEHIMATCSPIHKALQPNKIIEPSLTHDSNRNHAHITILMLSKTTASIQKQVIEHPQRYHDHLECASMLRMNPSNDEKSTMNGEF